MTTPASNTPYAIIVDAMQDAGRLQDGQYPTPEQLAKYLRRLQDLVNLWQTQGLKLWVNVDYSVTLTAGTATYTFGPSGSVVMTKPLRVIEAYYLSSENVRRPIYPLSWDDWFRLSTVSQQGQISQYFVNKQQTQLSVSFWLVPDSTAATGTAHLLLQEQITNPITLNETINFPVEWRMALHWGLADDISTGQPQAIMDRCAAKAATYRQMLEDWDVEDASTVFQPDQRATNYGVSNWN